MGLLENLFTFGDMIFNADEYADAGKSGERYTYRILDDLFPAKHICRNVYLPNADGRLTEIDLLAVGNKGIYVFESKNYSGWIFGNEADKQWTQSFQNAKVRFHNPIWQNKAHIHALKHNLALCPNIRYFSFVVFSERCELKKITVESPDTYVIKRDQLKKALSSIFDSGAPNTLTDAEKNAVAALLSKRERPDETVQRHHLEDLQEIFDTCPRCKGRLVERTAKATGKIFYGCSNFPKCRYMSDTKPTVSAVADHSDAPDAGRRETPEAEPAAQQQPAEDAPKTVGTCPRCKGQLVERTAKATGKTFYGCSNFPKCRYISNTTPDADA